MSRKLRHRRDRGLAYANPLGKSAVGSALSYLGIAAAAGGTLGAVGGAMAKTPDVMGGALAGGSLAVGVTSLGGFVVGLVSPANRNAGFATAGIGWGALILANLATAVAANVSKTST